jgi:hypothetical protein
MKKLRDEKMRNGNTLAKKLNPVVMYTTDRIVIEAIEDLIEKDQLDLDVIEMANITTAKGGRIRNQTIGSTEKDRLD